MVSSVSFAFISALIFKISFFLLTLGLFISSFLVALGVELGYLFDFFLVSWGMPVLLWTFPLALLLQCPIGFGLLCFHFHSFLCIFWSVPFLIRWLLCYLYILEIKSLSVTLFAGIFSQHVDCVFILSVVPFAVQKLSSLIRSYLLVFAFISFAVGFPGGSDGKESTGRPGFDPWVGKIPWRRTWQLTPIFMPGESQGLRGPVGGRLWGHRESDTTEVT